MITSLRRSLRDGDLFLLLANSFHLARLVTFPAAPQACTRDGNFWWTERPHQQSVLISASLRECQAPPKLAFHDFSIDLFAPLLDTPTAKCSVLLFAAHVCFLPVSERAVGLLVAVTKDDVYRFELATGERVRLAYFVPTYRM